MPCHAMLLRSFSLPPFEKKRVRRDCPRASGRGPARGCRLTTLSGVLVGTMIPRKWRGTHFPFALWTAPDQHCWHFGGDSRCKVDWNHALEPNSL
ncbi:hypothetical protein CMEL01_05275 [Colletotrichum melonis]|uniref:Uncharacterized protein n=1 Tax=Colletotrichum melonis TaxID=1209925 RepID=A0AAI9XMR7_9PEZI|nr:hypothetical protein CMEL01_05275 [Colletotrichum melonis]